MTTENKKILVIEDDISISTALEMKITGAGYDVIVASDGEDGLSKALFERPNLILLDIILPKMDGMTVLDNLRKDEWGKSVPVIVLSNLGTGDEIQRSRENNVKDFLIKTDWSMDDVVRKIKESLDEAGQVQGEPQENPQQTQ